MLFRNLAVKDDQQDDIEHDLRLTRRPPNLGAVYDRTDTAAVDQTVEPRTEQREYQRKAENIKNHLDIAFENLSAEEIKYRHKKHTAVQAEIRRFSGAYQSFEPRKQLNAHDADHRMEDRHDQRSVPFDPEVFFKMRQPYKRNDRRDGKDDIKIIMNKKCYQRQPYLC